MPKRGNEADKIVIDFLNGLEQDLNDDLRLGTSPNPNRDRRSLQLTADIRGKLAKNQSRDLEYCALMLDARIRAFDQCRPDLASERTERLRASVSESVHRSLIKLDDIFKAFAPPKAKRAVTQESSSRRARLAKTKRA